MRRQLSPVCPLQNAWRRHREDHVRSTYALSVMKAVSTFEKTVTNRAPLITERVKLRGNFHTIRRNTPQLHKLTPGIASTITYMHLRVAIWLRGSEPSTTNCSIPLRLHFHAVEIDRLGHSSTYTSDGPFVCAVVNPRLLHNHAVEINVVIVRPDGHVVDLCKRTADVVPGRLQLCLLLLALLVVPEHRYNTHVDSRCRQSQTWRSLLVSGIVVVGLSASKILRWHKPSALPLAKQKKKHRSYCAAWWRTGDTCLMGRLFLRFLLCFQFILNFASPGNCIH